ncbi:MAG TPA: zinc ribbon domain-containing protein [Candidatus Sulfotelmatobacter sp.]|nr:zinc ribbon domain-containing protein [Candidatus Sulfotelmatobacter sp.]
MAFCNSCGTTIVPGTRFCSKCGAPILASTLPPAPAAGTSTSFSSSTPASVPATTTAQGGSALKIILILVGVVVLLGIVGIASLGFVAWHVAHRAHIHQNGNNVKVETPFGSVETTKDPEEAARNLGVELYPGVEVLKDGANSATFGGVHTVSLNSQSTDSVDKVASFYKSKFPNAMVTTSDAGRCTIISDDHRNMVTINIEAEGDKTKIQITTVTRKPVANSSSN